MDFPFVSIGNIVEYFKPGLGDPTFEEALLELPGSEVLFDIS